MPEPVYYDMEICCQDCQRTFTFDEREQTFFASKGYQTPKRCVVCRRAKHARYNDAREYLKRASTEVECWDCHELALVDFQPAPDRPIYCGRCWQKHKSDSQGGSE